MRGRRQSRFVHDRQMGNSPLTDWVLTQECPPLVLRGGHRVVGCTRLRIKPSIAWWRRGDLNPYPATALRTHRNRSNR